MDKNIKEQYDKFPKTWPKFLVTFIVLLIVIVLYNYTVSFNGISDMGTVIAKEAIKGIFSPDWSIVFNKTVDGLPYLLFETLAIAFLGTVIGCIFAIPFAFLGSRNVAPLWVNEICLVVISIIRAFPSFVYGIMFVKAIGLGAFAGVLSMALSSLGMFSKLLIESIEDIDTGVIEALDSMGCSTFEKVRYGMIPQLSSNIVSIILYRFDINVKNATILGLVGAGGIGASLIFAINSRIWDVTGAYLLGVVVVTLVIEYFSTKLRNLLATGEKS